MSDNFDRTMELITNLDRTGVEKVLEQAKQLAEALGLKEVKSLLMNVKGKSPEELQDIINRACNSLIGKSEYQKLQDLLELAELNLPNLKLL